MQLHHEVFHAAASGDARSYLNNTAYLEGDKLVATDGSMMAVVPVEREPEDTDGFVQTEALKKAFKLAKPLPPMIKANGGLQFVDGSTMPRETKDGAKYPAWDLIMKTVADDRLSEVTIGIDAELFYRLAKGDRKSTRLNSSHIPLSRMPSSA